MEIDRWYGLHKVRAFPWIDRKRIYVNEQYFAPGQSLAQPPVWDKSVYITDDAPGRRLVFQFTQTLVDYITGLHIAEGTEIGLTVLPQQENNLAGAVGGPLGEGSA